MEQLQPEAHACVNMSADQIYLMISCHILVGCTAGKVLHR